jgi:hypothetical protein
MESLETRGLAKQQKDKARMSLMASIRKMFTCYFVVLKFDFIRR